MPIRINLLAEQQAAEELRRRDPVKRVGWVSGFVVGLLFVWGAYLQFKLMAASRETSRVETDWKKLEPDYNKVITNLNLIADAQRKWTGLQNLASNRFLWANVLNALQYTVVDEILVTGLKTEQSYVLTEGVKPSTNVAGVVSRGKPATSREKVAFVIEGRDYSSSPDRIFKFQETISSNAYFKANSLKTELTHRSAPQPDTGASSANSARLFVFFTIECQFPEKVR